MLKDHLNNSLPFNNSSIFPLRHSRGLKCDLVPDFQAMWDTKKKKGTIFFKAPCEMKQIAIPPPLFPTSKQLQCTKAKVKLYTQTYENMQYWEQTMGESI